MSRLWKSSVESLGKWERVTSRRMQAPQYASGLCCDKDGQATSDVVGVQVSIGTWNHRRSWLT